MKPRLYIETTIPSYLTARRSRVLRLAADQATTEEWWDDCKHEYELYTSQVVIAEAGCGDPKFATARLAKLADIPLLDVTIEAEELAKRLLRDQIIPLIASDDASHVAIAAAHGVEFLLTWNCRHINNHRIRARIERACAAAGMLCPDICTPAELMTL